MVDVSRLFMHPVPGPDSVTIPVALDASGYAQIRYATNPDLSNATTSPSVQTGGGFSARIPLSNLASSTQYYYEVLADGVAWPTASSGDIGKTQDGDPPRFRTAPEAGTHEDFDFIFYSCFQSGGNTQIWPGLASKSPRFVCELGDNGYPDSNAAFSGSLDDYRGNFAFLAQNSAVSNWFRTRYVVHRCGGAHCVDDHDYGGGESDKDFANKQNCIDAFLERGAFQRLADPANGLWHSFEYGDCLFVALDARTQRRASKSTGPITGVSRFPTSGTLTADIGSGDTTLNINSSDSPDTTANAYQGHYAKVVTGMGTYWRRVESSADAGGGAVTCTLNASVPGLDELSTYFIKDASIFDGERLLSAGQVDWMVDLINATERYWIFILAPQPWNRLAFSDDNHRSVDSEVVELQFIAQAIDSDRHERIIILSGDSHRMGLSDNSVTETFFAAEFMGTPLDRSPSEGTHTWNKGKSPFPPGSNDPSGGSGRYFGLVKVRRRSVYLQAWWGGNILSGSPPVRMTQIQGTIVGGRSPILKASGIIGG